MMMVNRFREVAPCCGPNVAKYSFSPSQSWTVFAVSPLIADHRHQREPHIAMDIDSVFEIVFDDWADVDEVELNLGRELVCLKVKRSQWSDGAG